MIVNKKLASRLAAIQAITNRIEGGILDVINSTVGPKPIGPQTAFSEQRPDQR